MYEGENVYTFDFSNDELLEYRAFSCIAIEVVILATFRSIGKIHSYFVGEASRFVFANNETLVRLVRYRNPVRQ